MVHDCCLFEDYDVADTIIVETWMESPKLTISPKRQGSPPVRQTRQGCACIKVQRSGMLNLTSLNLSTRRF